MARALIPAADSPLRRPLGVALLIVVTLAHLWLSDELLEDRLGFGAQREVMRRIEVSYVRELAVAAPPVPAAAPPKPKPRPRRAAVAKAPAASAPASSVLDGAIIVKVEPLPAPVVATPSPLAEQPAPPLAAASQPAIVPPETAASAPLAVAVASATPAAAAASAPAFDWPPSTRLTYVMNGNYRGEVQGSATVEWIRVGLRYQVHMEAIVGASFAPLLVRRASSEGELGDNGLTPRRFEGEQRVAFKSRRWAMSFDPERVHLPEGREVPAPPGVQDEASLFVQLTWLFTTQPQALRAGRRIEVPLALPRRVDTWTYDVIGEETLRMPFGEVSTVHVKPRRPARSTDLSAQMWFAPGLQYLPVRILVHQDTDTFIDLQLQRAPQQSAER